MNVNIRALAAKCLFSVVDKGRSLSDELPVHQEKAVGKDKGLLQELCYGVLRFLPELEYETQQLMDKPLTGKQRTFHFLLLVGLYQIKHTRIPDHAAVSETVAATSILKNKHLKGLVNAVLRNFQRKQELIAKQLLQAESSGEPLKKPNLPNAIAFNHPGWFIKKLLSAYPEQWQNILIANQDRPPMWLRVNQLHHTVEQYTALLTAQGIAFDLIDEKSGAIKLSTAVDVFTLPGFELGHVSIQDGAAQQAAILLDAQPNEHILDCCAAPGGKTCHILESQPKLASMTAVDIEEKRLVRVHENLTRLKLQANVIAGDATQPEAWWNGELFDRILLDVPCSATGVIRRHPDIKWLRKANDIEKLTELQYQIVKKIWSLLKPGGTFIYATCSVLPEENKQQVTRFLTEHNDATHISITEHENDIGWQILPSDNAMDGFYYAKIIKAEQ